MSTSSSIVAYLDTSSINKNILHYCGNIAKAMKKPLKYYDIDFTPSLALSKGVASSSVVGTAGLEGELIKETEQKLQNAVNYTRQFWLRTSHDHDIGFGVNDLGEKLESLKKRSQSEAIKLLITIRDQYDVNSPQWSLSRVAAIVKKAACPVLVIPKYEPYKEIKKITYILEEGVLPIDDIRLCAELAAGYGSELEILYLTSPENPYYHAETVVKRYQIKEQINYDNIAVRKLLSPNLEAIYNLLLLDRNTDLLAFTYNSVPYLNRLLNRSTSEKVILEANVPVLAF